MKLRFCFILCICFIIKLNGQEDRFRKNVIYTEFYGNGGTLISINYERMVNVKPNSSVHIFLREGFTFKHNKYDSTLIYVFPIEVNCIIGRKAHCAEVGVGATLFWGTSNLSTQIPIGYKKNFQYLFTLRVGYRFIDTDRIIVRFSPLLVFEQVNPESNKLRLSWTVGASLGFCFDRFGKASTWRNAFEKIQ